MIKKSFIGLSKTRLEYDHLGTSLPGIRSIPLPGIVKLFSDHPIVSTKGLLIKAGDQLKTGQKILFSSDSEDYFISPVTGKIKSIAPQTGDFGKVYTAISIEKAEDEDFDDGFKDSFTEPSIEVVRDFLKDIPGGGIPETLLSGNTVKNLVIMGMDEDLLLITRQYSMKANISALRKGVEALKNILSLENIYISAPEGLSQEAIAMGAKVIIADSEYPSANPVLLFHKATGAYLPEGKTFEDMGFSFISVESVVSLGRAFEENKVPFTKNITIIGPSGERTMVAAFLGTPLKQIFNILGIQIKEMDRIIIGGPMTGSAAYSEDFPVMSDTDAVIVQNKDNIPYISDKYCINCGECARYCPARIQVNLLVRYLEARQYEEAEERYDLASCLECGLCSYVCQAKIPVFQYIKLAKYELARIRESEAENV